MVEYSEEIELKNDLKNEQNDKQPLNDNQQKKCQSKACKKDCNDKVGNFQNDDDIINDGVGHSHGGPKRKKMLCPSIFYNFMVIQHYIFMYFYLQQIEHAFDFWICLISFNFFTFMTQLSYFTAMFTNNRVGFKLDQKKENKAFIDLFMIPKPCDNCEVIKCGRINHCSNCNQCQNRMDHHCPWTLNCIAQRNHKSFLLYNMYLTISIAQNLYYGYFYQQYLNLPAQLESIDPYFKTYWHVYMCVILLIFLWVSMLFITHSQTMYSNVTTLEYMKGTQMKWPFQIGYYMINIWDQGLIANIIFFLDNRYFLWWYPTLNYQFDDGLSIPKNPCVPKKDFIAFKYKDNPEILKQIEQENQEVDFEEEIQKFKLKKNIILQYDGQLIRL